MKLRMGFDSKNREMESSFCLNEMGASSAAKKGAKPPKKRAKRA